MTISTFGSNYTLFVALADMRFVLKISHWAEKACSYDMRRGVKRENVLVCRGAMRARGELCAHVSHRKRPPQGEPVFRFYGRERVTHRCSLGETLCDT